MRLIADYHIHSNNCKFKFVKSSIEEIVRRADALGLEEIAISDHGYKHFFACNKEKLFEARKLIDELNLTSGTNILLGIEANIISEDGQIDVDDETLSIVDILIIGYHKMIKTDFISYFGFQKKTYQAIEKATNAYINAIKRYDVDIVAHPGDGIKVDLYKIGKACEENDVMFELNNRHLNYTEQDIYDLLSTNCNFIASSDAQNIASIGNVDKVMQLIEKYQIPSDRIFNIKFAKNKRSKIDRLIDDDIQRFNEVRKRLNIRQVEPLSDEVEQQLREIEIKKGIASNKNELIEIDPKLLLSDSDRAIIERAEEFIKTHKNKR